MRIHCVGINHKSAPLSLLERLHLTEQQVSTTLARSGCSSRGQLASDPMELAFISTCNRIELYGLLLDPGHEPLGLILAEAADVDLEEILPYLYHFEGLTAVKHLLRVACGLDSMVVGEPQVLGQVANAYSLALQANSVGVVINRIFQTAIRGGKRARTETEIATRPATMSSVAVHFVASIVREIQSSRIAILGAGEMAELTVEALRKRGVERITVINRTVGRATELANRWNASAKSFESLVPELQESDVLLTSTGAPHPLVGSEEIREIMLARPDKPLVILDIAVPRDVDPSVADLHNVHLYDLESLSEHLQGSTSQRLAEVPAVDAIIEQELAVFRDWFQTFDIRPIIAELHQKAEVIRVEQVRKTLSQLDNLGDRELEAVEAMSKALVKRLLHDPIMHLKRASRKGTTTATALAARQLFDLNADRQRPSRAALREDDEA